MARVNFSKYQVGAMVSIPLAVMLNPLTVEIYLDVVKQVLEGVSFLAIAYLVVFILVKVLKPEPVKLPSVGKVSKGKSGMKYEVAQ